MHSPSCWPDSQSVQSATSCCTMTTSRGAVVLSSVSFSHILYIIVIPKLLFYIRIHRNIFVLIPPLSKLFERVWLQRGIGPLSDVISFGPQPTHISDTYFNSTNKLVCTDKVLLGLFV